MEDSTTPGRETAVNVNQKTTNKPLMSNKPLHRILQKDPRSLGIAILIFGCAELLMGFQLASQEQFSSNHIYVPFWQGALFVTCGILSICTDLKPSKKMVTICLAMYVVSILGILVSFGYRIHLFIIAPFLWYNGRNNGNWGQQKFFQIISIEAMLSLSSLCVSGILIFLSTVARFALKSSHTQVIVHWVPQAEPQGDPTSD